MVTLVTPMKWLAVAIVGLLIGVAVGWGLSTLVGPAGVSTTTTQVPTPAPTTVIVKENYTVVVDDLGRVVHVARPVERVISVSSGVNEIIYALGCGDMLVGRDSYSSFPPQVKNVTVVYSKEGLNLELALSLEPDVVFAWWYQRYKLEQLEEHVPVIYVCLLYTSPSPRDRG